MVGVGSELWVVLDGYADGGLGGDLVGALGQQEPEGVGVDISSRNTMSVMEDIENAGSTLVLRLMAIVKCLCLR